MKDKAPIRQAMDLLSTGGYGVSLVTWEDGQRWLADRSSMILMADQTPNAAVAVPSGYLVTADIADGCYRLQAGKGLIPLGYGVAVPEVDALLAATNGDGWYPVEPTGWVFTSVTEQGALSFALWQRVQRDGAKPVVLEARLAVAWMVAAQDPDRRLRMSQKNHLGAIRVTARPAKPDWFDYLGHDRYDVAVKHWEDHPGAVVAYLMPYSQQPPAAPGCWS